MAEVLANKEQVDMLMDVSGQMCFVHARYQASMVTGYICKFDSSKQYNFEFQPLSEFKKKQMLYLELKRLYFDFRRNQVKDKYEMVLDFVREEDQPVNDFNLLDTHMIYLG